MHHRTTKMYKDLKKSFLVARNEKRCGQLYGSQQVKAEHLRLVGLIQPLEIPMWKDIEKIQLHMVNSRSND